MSHFLPNYSRSGVYLQPTQVSTHYRNAVPYYQANSQRVPVVSTLKSSDPMFKLTSYVASQHSPPFCSVRGYEPAICSKYKQQFSFIESTPMMTLNEAITSDSEDSDHDTEHGMCVQTEFVHKNTTYQMNKAAYEILLHMCRLLSYASCFQELQPLMDETLDTSLYYEVVPLAASRLELQNPVLAPLNAHYESYARFLCGCNIHDHGEDMRHVMNLLQRDFYMCLLDEHVREPIYKKRFTLHRLVSFKICYLRTKF